MAAFSFEIACIVSAKGPVTSVEVLHSAAPLVGALQESKRQIREEDEIPFHSDLPLRARHIFLFRRA